MVAFGKSYFFKIKYLYPEEVPIWILLIRRHQKLQQTMKYKFPFLYKRENECRIKFGFHIWGATYRLRS